MIYEVVLKTIKNDSVVGVGRIGSARSRSEFNCLIELSIKNWTRQKISLLYFYINQRKISVGAKGANHWVQTLQTVQTMNAHGTTKRARVQRCKAWW